MELIQRVKHQTTGKYSGLALRAILAQRGGQWSRSNQLGTIYSPNMEANVTLYFDMSAPYREPLYRFTMYRGCIADESN